MSWTTYESPLGTLTLVAEGGALRRICFPEESPRGEQGEGGELCAVAAQLAEYFDGRRQGFDLPVELRGTPFQLAVWERLSAIPYGETVSYGELAAGVDPGLFPAGTEPHQRARAVGTEVGRTPTPIVVPCHRVIGADGSLTGYGGGLHRKQALLELEGSGRPDPAWKTRQTSLL